MQEEPLLELLTQIVTRLFQSPGQLVVFQDYPWLKYIVLFLVLHSIFEKTAVTCLRLYLQRNLGGDNLEMEYTPDRPGTNEAFWLRALTLLFPLSASPARQAKAIVKEKKAAEEKFE